MALKLIAFSVLALVHTGDYDGICKDANALAPGIADGWTELESKQDKPLSFTDSKGNPQVAEPGDALLQVADANGKIAFDLLKKDTPYAWTVTDAPAPAVAETTTSGDGSATATENTGEAAAPSTDGAAAAGETTATAETGAAQ